MEVSILRQKYPKFIYRNYSYKISGGNLKVSFLFEIPPDIKFRPKIIIKNVRRTLLLTLMPGDVKRSVLLTLENLVFHVGLIEMLSYWKATCSSEIIIEAGYLNKDQIKWWKNLIINGMGQFFYENKIDWRKPDFLKIKLSRTHLVPTRNVLDSLVLDNLKDRYLVPFAGGRDSIVTLEKMKERKKEITLFTVNPISRIRKAAKVSGIKKQIIAKRTVDKKLLALNKKGYLNGHTPFTCLLSFISVLCAVLFDYKNIVFSNEKSANEGNVKYLGRIINHQWAKSSEFEKMFRSYCKKYLVKDINYFSYLRKHTDLEISKTFAKYPKYFPVFSSCNAEMRVGSGGSLDAKKRWCAKCPKCLFVYMGLYPYLEKKQLLKIFGKDLFEDKSLMPTMNDLLGRGRHKPFECVGTRKESRTAFKLSLEKAKKSGKIPYLLLKQKGLPRETTSQYKMAHRPLHFNYSMLENLVNGKILILGFGREGQDTFKFLRKLFPKKKIGIADRKFDKNYLKKINDYDIIIKTPGIPFKLLRPDLNSKITTQTEIFFENCPGMIVGITGTKGKSTTSYWIYQVLKNGGLKAHLVGNIGKPVLTHLLKAEQDDIFVYELSSHQLFNLKKSPHIAVLLNIYPEHLDYYKSFKEYAVAKANITKYQTRDDYLIYNSTDPLVRKIASNSKAKKIPIRGKYYGLNLAAAQAVARIFKLPMPEKLKSLPHRLEYIGKFRGIEFYNDSLSTVPETAIEALDFLGDKVQTMILGGYDRGLDFKKLAKRLSKSRVKTLILFPTTGKRIWQALFDLRNRTIQPFFADNMEKAVKLAYKYTNKGKICLLSPASPSFGIFKNYSERGDLFKKFVKKYGRR